MTERLGLVYLASFWSFEGNIGPSSKFRSSPGGEKLPLEQCPPWFPQPETESVGPYHSKGGEETEKKHLESILGCPLNLVTT